MDENIIFRTQHLSKFFFGSRRKHFISFNQKQFVVKALNEVTMDVEAGSTYALVGESGSGKTTLGYMTARIFKPTSGSIWFDGRDITHAEGRELRELRQNVQMVFQDPGSSLNPRHTIESILFFPLKIHTPLTGKEIKNKIKELLESVDLPMEILRRYPGTLSGGQKQRVSLARALALNPKLLVLDEPTSALDVSVQAKILHLLIKLKEQFGLTYIFITHDMSVVRNISDIIAVMYLGRIIELGRTPVIFKHPIHPYTKALLSAIPVVTEDEQRLLPKEVILEGEIPSPMDPPETCSFLSRCQEKIEICGNVACPDLVEIESNHFVRCLIAYG